MSVSLALEEAACLLIFLEGLSVAVCFNCHSRSEESLLQAERVTSALFLAATEAFDGSSNHILQFTESMR